MSIEQALWLSVLVTEPPHPQEHTQQFSSHAGSHIVRLGQIRRIYTGTLDLLAHTCHSSVQGS